jgi:hypothetical protein
MRRCLVLAGGLLLLGCQSEPADETPDVPADTVAASRAISLEDIAGTWDVRYVPESGDTTVTSLQIRVRADGWTLLLADRDPIVGAVMTSGDSIIVVEGPYESIRRDGVMVTTHSVTGWRGPVGGHGGPAPTSGAGFGAGPPQRGQADPLSGNTG